MLLGNDILNKCILNNFLSYQSNGLVWRENILSIQIFGYLEFLLSIEILWDQGVVVAFLILIL